MLRPLAPVPFADLPSFIKVHPKKSSTIVIMSNQGLVNVIDVAQPGGAPDFVQVSCFYFLIAFDRV